MPPAERGAIARSEPTPSPHRAHLGACKRGELHPVAARALAAAATAERRATAVAIVAVEAGGDEEPELLLLLLLVVAASAPRREPEREVALSRHQPHHSRHHPRHRAIARQHQTAGFNDLTPTIQQVGLARPLGTAHFPGHQRSRV